MIHVRQIKNDLFHFLSSNRNSSSSPPLIKSMITDGHTHITLLNKVKESYNVQLYNRKKNVKNWTWWQSTEMMVTQHWWVGLGWARIFAWIFSVWRHLWIFLFISLCLGFSSFLSFGFWFRSVSGAGLLKQTVWL